MVCSATGRCVSITPGWSARPAGSQDAARLGDAKPTASARKRVSFVSTTKCLHRPFWQLRGHIECHSSRNFGLGAVGAHYRSSPAPTWLTASARFTATSRPGFIRRQPTPAPAASSPIETVGGLGEAGRGASRTTSGDTFGEVVHVASHKTEDQPCLPPLRDVWRRTRP